MGEIKRIKDAREDVLENLESLAWAVFNYKEALSLHPLAHLNGKLEIFSNRCTLALAAIAIECEIPTSVIMDKMRESL